MRILKKFSKKEEKAVTNSKEAAKERLHLVLMQDRANVSADFLELMKQEIIEVIKKYIDVDENEIDVRLTNKENEDGTNGAPALYANIPIVNIKNEAKKVEGKEEQTEQEKEHQEEEFVKDDSVKSEKEEVVQEDKKDNQIQEVSQELKEDSSDKKEVSEDKIADEENGQEGAQQEQQKKNEELKPEN